jgi:hypothetical protein
MAEYSRLARGFFTSTGAAQVINLPFQPDFVEFTNYTSNATPANHGIPYARWDANMGQGFAVADLFNGTPVKTTGVVITNGISTFAAGQLLQFGASQQIIGITKANPASINVTAHGYNTGDVVMLQGLKQSATTGMQQIAGIPFVVTRTNADNFTIPWNTNQSSYTALSGSPSGALVKKVLYPYLYSPTGSVISAVTTGTTTTVVTTTAHNFVVGQEVAFRIPSNYGITQLNSLPNVSIPGSPVYGYVTTVTNSTTFVVNINSVGYTAYANNVAFASSPGLSFPMVVSVGDINTGGAALTATSALYPSPLVNAVSTINGPAINGAFVNNTSAGFIIGSGATVSDASSVLVGANADVIYWRALLHDM